MAFTASTMRTFQEVSQNLHDVRFAPSLKGNFADFQLHIDVCHVRLSRLGQVSGLINGKPMTTTTDATKEKDVRRYLERTIQDVFSQLPENTDPNNMGRPRIASTDSGLYLGPGECAARELLNPESDDFPRGTKKRLHKILLETVKDRGCPRQPGGYIGEVCGTVILSATQFQGFIGLLNYLMDVLEKQFRDRESQAAFQRLRTEECDQLSEAELKALVDIAGPCDLELKKAAIKDLGETMKNIEEIAARGQVYGRTNYGDMGTQNAHSYNGQYSGNSGTINAQMYSGRYSGNSGTMTFMRDNFAHNGTVNHHTYNGRAPRGFD